MPSHEMTPGFSSLSKEQKLIFLCSLGMRLTVLVRAYHMEIDDQSQLVVRIMSINEAQHKIFGRLGDIISPSKAGYGDNTFESSLRALSQDKGFEDDFIAAWNFALKTVDADR